MNLLSFSGEVTGTCMIITWLILEIYGSPF